MLRSNVPRAVRNLRRRHGWRQEDVARAARVSREAVSRLERGVLRGVTVGVVERVLSALDADLDLSVRWHGAELDRLIDAIHARLQEDVAAELTQLGWLVRTEVSFNQYGDRGRVDILAISRDMRLLLVVEVKSAIGDLQDTLGRLDVKTRLGKAIAREVGWNGAVSVVPVLAVRDTRSVRRLIAGHATLFDRYRVRGRQAAAWLRRRTIPVPTGLLLYVKLPDSHGVTATRDRRVRNRQIGS